jgi:hypothetical protein
LEGKLPGRGWKRQGKIVGGFTSNAAARTRNC